MSEKFLSHMIHQGCLCSRHFPTLFHSQCFFYISIVVSRCKMYMAFETRGLYVSVNIKPSYPCNIVIFTQNVNFLVWHLFHRNQKYFQIFYIFHHSNVFVIVKRLAENYVNPQAFDMYKFGCFENWHFSRQKPLNLSEDCWFSEEVSDFKQSEVRSSDAPFRRQPIFTIFGLDRLAQARILDGFYRIPTNFPQMWCCQASRQETGQDRNFNGLKSHFVLKSNSKKNTLDNENLGHHLSSIKSIRLRVK